MASAWIEAREGKKGKSYRVGWRDHARKRRYSKPFTRKTDAVNFKRNLEHSLGAGTYVDPAEGKITLGQFFHHFMANPPVTTGLKPSTRALYETHARLYILPGLGDRPLNSIRRQDVSAFLSGLERPRGGVVGASTKEHVYRQLRRLLNYAVLEGRIAANPARGLTVEKAQSLGPRFMSADEVEELVHAHPDRYRALILLACWTGPRFGELSALRVKHLDYLRRRVSILGAASHVGGRRYEGTTKTRRTRSVPVPPNVWDALVMHVERYGDPKDPEAYVFTAAEGGPVRPDNFRQRVFARAVREAGLVPKPTIHDMRHTAASLMAQAGFSLLQAAQVLGHGTQYMTAHYTHLFPEDLEAMAERLSVRRQEAAGRLSGRQGASISNLRRPAGSE